MGGRRIMKIRVQIPHLNSRIIKTGPVCVKEIHIGFAVL
jgi:hypothetical protein